MADNSTATETLAQRVQRLREAMGWNKKELAERAGVHPSHIGLIERSGRVGVRPETIKKIAGAFGITASSLMGETHDEEAGSHLESYREAIEAARAHGLTPDQLTKLIMTAAALFQKK